MTPKSIQDFFNSPSAHAEANQSRAAEVVKEAKAMVVYSGYDVSVKKDVLDALCSYLQKHSTPNHNTT